MLWWTVQNVAITTLLAGVVWLTCRLVKAGPVTRHALWLLVLLKMLTPPMVEWPWPAPVALSNDAPKITHPSIAISPSAPSTSLSQAPKDIEIGDEITSPVGGVSSSAYVENTPAVPRHAAVAGHRRPSSSATISPRIKHLILPALGLVWVTGAILFTLLQCVRITTLLRTARSAAPPCPCDPRLPQRVQAMSRMLRVRAPRLRIVNGIGSPLIFSLFRPQLWWPAELGPQLSDDALCGLIIHELAHVKRRDHWVGWLELLAGCVWWWNPLYWYVRFQLRENAELACDGWVVEKLPRGRRAYGEALLAVCECLVGRTTPLPALGVDTGGRQFLERRLTMILRERIGLRLHAAGLLFVGLLAMAALPAWSQEYEAAKPEQQVEKTTTALTDTLADYSRSYISFLDVNRAGPAQPLPNDAQQVLQQFNQDQQAVHREAEAKIAEMRQKTIERLKALQDQYAHNDQLDEAVAIRDRIRRLQGNNATTASNRIGSRIRVQGDPGNLTAYRDRIGQSFNFNVVGSTSGNVWGSGVYTDDSALATAAVHAGILKDGERGIVRVTIAPGQESYEGSTANGVTSMNYGQWEGSYRVQSADSTSERSTSDRLHTSNVQTDPGTLTALRDHVDMEFTFRVTGSEQGTIWGGADHIYTDDSPLATAAVHAGVLQAGETGTVHVRILPGRDSYEGCAQNGVKSLDYGSFSGSYLIEPDRTRLRGELRTPHEGEARKF